MLRTVVHTPPAAAMQQQCDGSVETAGHVHAEAVEPGVSKREDSRTRDLDVPVAVEAGHGVLESIGCCSS